MKLFSKISLVAIIFATPVKAEWNPIYTVQDYYTTCVMEPPTVTFSDGMQAGICLGFLRGIASFAQLNCNLGFGPKFVQADLVGISFLAQQQAMRNWAENNPVAWQDHASTVVMALSESWPCSN